MIGILRGLTAGVALIAAAGGASAQDYPQHPIRFIIPAASGGPTEITGRLLAEKMQADLGQPVVVEAIPGAGGNIGASNAAKSEPDGYTIFMGTIGTHAINQTLYGKLPFDPLGDFEPVSLVVQYPLLLAVHPSFPAQNVEELIAYAKENPGEINRASGGSGTSMHLAGELFQSQAELDMPHVPYQGSAPALTDLSGNFVQLMFDSLITTLPLVESGKIRALATTGEERSPAAPDIPTVTESGLPGYSAYGWIGVLVPEGTPQAIIDRLNASITTALADEELRETLQSQGAEPVGSSPTEFEAFIRAETEKWGAAVRKAGVTVQ